MREVPILERPVRRLDLALVVIVTVAVSCAHPVEAQSMGTLESATALRDSVSAWVRRGWLVGAEVLVTQDDETILHDAIGAADRESGRPLATNSLFRIRSMVKPFIGTAILMLQQEGRISVDDRVAEYLRGFDNDRSDAVRIHELLTHTSGLGDHGTEDIGLPRAPGEYESLDALVRDIGAIGPRFPRGEFRYSDSGSATLAAVISAVSGLPVEEFLSQRLFEPLGMSDTYTHFAADSTWAGGLSSTYRWSPLRGDFERSWSPREEQRFAYFRGSGGVYSTPRDYAQFMQMWMAAIQGSDAELISTASASAALEPEPGRMYGFQWTIPDGPAHSGLPSSFMHGGSDGTLAIAIPEERLVILVFTQSRGVPLFSWVLGAVARTPSWAAYVPSEYRRGTSRTETFPSRAPLSDSDAHLFMGQFTSAPTNDGPASTVTIWRTGPQLHLRFDPEGRPGLAMRDLVHVGEDRFVLGRVVRGRWHDYFPEDGFVEFSRSGNMAFASELRFRGLVFRRSDSW